jgi:uncharacterized protein YqgC (DUF456 family)
MLTGLLGSFLPFIPGTPLIVLGAFIYGFATDFQTIGYGRLLVLVGLSGLAYALDYTAGAMGAKKFGGSRVLGELVRSRKLDDSMKSAFGTMVGMLLGTVAKLSLAVVMVALFLWWIWN